MLFAAGAAALRAASIFDFVPPPKLFGVCYSTVHTVTKEKVGDSDIAGSVEPVCYKHIASFAREQNVRTLDVMDHCSELGGRVAEAEAGGYLADGAKVCASIVEEDASASGAALDMYLPVESAPEEERAAFCTAFQDKVAACKPEGPTTSTTLAPLPFVPPPPRAEWDGK